MRRILHQLYLLVLAALLSVSCGQQRQGRTPDNEAPIPLKYAQLLTLSRGKGYVVAEIKNPWDTTRVLHRYVLVHRSRKLPEELPQGEVVRTPLQNAVYYTSIHVSLVNELGGYESIGGLCDTKYMTLPQLRKDLADGLIADCGSGPAPNLERIVDLNPDAILLSPFENSGSYGKLGALGIPIIECADYMETGPLARAEWMHFYGLLIGREQEARQLFTRVEEAYNGLKQSVQHVKKRPTVVDGKKFGSQWYVAGGQSTIGQLIADAGGRYVFAGVEASGSVPYSPERVFDQAREADVWMMKIRMDVPLTYSLLAQEWDNYAEMEAHKKRNIYVCDLGRVDYYEETPFHPDRILADYIHIFHPEALPQHRLRYYQRMTN